VSRTYTLNVIKFLSNAMEDRYSVYFNIRYIKQFLFVLNSHESFSHALIQDTDIYFFVFYDFERIYGFLI